MPKTSKPIFDKVQKIIEEETGIVYGSFDLMPYLLKEDIGNVVGKIEEICFDIDEGIYK